MDRPPTSRGSDARPGTGQGLRPLTGQGTGRPGTGQRAMLGSAIGNRPGTNRLNTGQVPSTPGQTAGYGISLNTDVTVTERPVTQQGMMGMKTGTSGGTRRQIQDASFYIGKLHQKTNEINIEINHLKEEIEQDMKDRNQYAQLEKKYEILINEVRTLEGQLADYNLAMDKLRSSTDPNELLDIQNQLKNRNKKESDEIDKIFMMRQEKENSIRQLDIEIEKIHKQQQSRMNELAPDKLQEYNELCEKNDYLEKEINERTNEYELLKSMLESKENELKNDIYRTEYKKNEAIVLKLRQDKNTFEEELNTLKLDPEEARKIMLQKVKNDKLKMEEIDKLIYEHQEDINRLKNLLVETNQELEERKNEMGNGPGSGAQKYEKLLQRDQEMTLFIDSFEEKKKKELEIQENTKNIIIHLLEHISLSISRENNIPTKDKLNELQQDLTFKERQLENSNNTKQRLEIELNKRNTELEKIDVLDTKIGIELNSLNDKINTMISDMNEFEKIDLMKENAEKTKQYLVKLKTQYIKRRDAIKTQVNILSNIYELKKNKLNENDTRKNLDSLEQKLRHYEQSIFHLKQYIDSKSREIDYSVIKDDCLKLIEEINNLLIKSQNINQLTDKQILNISTQSKRMNTGKY